MTILAGLAQFAPGPAANGFRAGNTTDQLSIPQQPAQPRQLVTAEQRGDIFMARKMYREAMEKYGEVQPVTAQIYNKLGIAHHQTLDLKGARQYYQRAVKLDSHYSEAINNLGTVYYGEKSYGKAIKYYKKALKISPDSASVYSNLGTAYFARRQYKDAVESYQKAMAIDPDVFEHRSSYGVLLQERSVDDLAVFHYYMAKVYAKRGMSDRAMLYIRKALEEGFKDRQRFVNEPEFGSLQQMPEFVELLALQPRVL
jgi:tetratricopeptide (TPR) repeat protein